MRSCRRRPDCVRILPPDWGIVRCQLVLHGRGAADLMFRIDDEPHRPRGHLPGTHSPSALIMRMARQLECELELHESGGAASRCGAMIPSVTNHAEMHRFARPR